MFLSSSNVGSAADAAFLSRPQQFTALSAGIGGLWAGHGREIWHGACSILGVKTLAVSIALGFIANPVYCADPNPVEIVTRSVVNYQKDWQASLDFAYTERDVTKDATGRPKTTEVSQITVIDGTPYSRLIAKNGRPLSSEDARREEEKFQKTLAERDKESPEQRARRIRKHQQEWSFLSEIPEAFNITLAGHETVGGRPNYVIEMTPRPGYTPKARFAHIFTSVQGRLWIDQEDLRWTKAEADVIGTVAMGWILARIGPGAHITIKQVKVDGEHWMPKELDINGSARIMLVKNRVLDETVSYSDYKRVRSQPGTAAARNQ